MPWDYSAKTRDLLQRLKAFFEHHIYPTKGATAPKWMCSGAPAIRGSRCG